MERYSRASGKRNQPERVSGFDTQWTGPDASLIVANVLEALSEMRHAADYGLHGRLSLVFGGLIR
jgi:hypothetical protein